MNKRRLTSIILVAVGAVLLILVYFNRQTMKDYYIVATTDVSASSASLANKLDLTKDGEFLYEASQPELQPAHQFRGSCAGLEQQNIVLGCYTNQRIYIFDVNSKQLSGVREVTAAHELLHAAYARLSTSERKKVDAMLRAQRAKITDKRVLETLELYSKDTPAELLNEMHSIFGTESKKLSPDLESYYKKYFNNRETIVALSDKYQSVFTDLKNQAAGLRTQYKNLEAEKNRDESQLNRWQQELRQQKAKLDGLRSNPSEYNSNVPSFNLLVNQYNALIASYKQTINQMNEIISKLNQNITQQNDLTKKLDSNYSSY